MKSLIKKFIPLFLLDWYHLSLSFLGAVLYQFPSRKLRVIGVTGTNGKSTVVHLITKIMEEAGFKTASLSSIKFKIGDREWQNTLKMTMPGRFRLQKFLRQAVDAGCQYVVIEVTSEGIKQHRHRFIKFDAAVITNLTPEHIEAHGSFEKYKEAKGRLFRACKNIHIINADDPNAEFFLQFPAKQKISFAIYRSRTAIINNRSSTAINLNLRLPGRFNLYNAAAAMAVGLSYDIDLAICRKTVESIESIPGRMEVVIKKPFRVIVDYAHTPDALRKVYETLRNSKPQNTNSKTICVLGACGGGRDKWKRPELGKIASQYCDAIILTNEDPYDENPQHILNQIESGFSQVLNPKSRTPNHMKILDRREAIKKALSLAKMGDTVIITGKGSEPWMCVAGGKKISWDDREIVRDEFSKLNL